MQSRFFIMVVFALLFLAGHSVAQERKADTIVTVRFPAQTMQVPMPVRYIEVPKYETVYVCPPTVAPMYWSEYSGSFQAFVNDAALFGRVAYIDKDVQPFATIDVPSGLQLKADTSVAIRNKVRVLFRLHAATGSQLFEGLRIVQDSGCTAFERITSGVAFYDSLHNVQVTGGEAAYSSSRGGTASKMAVTAMRNCRFDVRYIALSAFSQDGPWRALHLYNVQMKTSYSHNLYVHPSTSLCFDSVASMGAGKLMMHQFSHNGLLKLINKDYKGDGVGDYYSARYSIFKRVYCNGEAFEMTPVDSTLNNGYNRIWIEDSDIGPYVTGAAPVATVNAYRTSFFNAGNGILIAGILDSCRGGAWGVDGYRLSIRRSNMSEVVFRYGGQIFISNSRVENIWGADRPVKGSATITLQNSQVGSYWGMGTIPVTISMTGSTIGRYGGSVKPKILER